MSLCQGSIQRRQLAAVEMGRRRKVRIGELAVRETGRESARDFVITSSIRRFGPERVVTPGGHLEEHLERLRRARGGRNEFRVTAHADETELRLGGGCPRRYPNRPPPLMHGVVMRMVRPDKRQQDIHVK